MVCGQPPSATRPRVTITLSKGRTAPGRRLPAGTRRARREGAREGAVWLRILLTRDLDDILSMREAVDAVRSAFEDAGRNPLLNTPRRRVHTPAGVRVSVHQGAPVSLGGTGLMTHCELVGVNAAEQVYTVKHPPVHVLFDATDGHLMALLVGDPGSPGAPRHALSGLRTAATSAVGTEVMAASKRAVSLGLFGSGEQARYHVLALNEVLELERVTVYSRSVTNCEAFATEMRARLPHVAFTVAGSPDEVVDVGQVVLCCTNSNVPVFDGGRLRPGQHVTSIVGSNVGLVAGGFLKQKRREVDDATILGADRIMVNSVDQLRVDEQADVYEHARDGRISWDKVCELSDVLVGKTPGRRGAKDLTLFKNNAGQGIADVAIGMAVLRAAERRGLGMEVDVDATEGKRLR